MPASLLTLPREIRDQIYSYLLVSPGVFIQTVPTSTHRRGREHTSASSQTYYKLLFKSRIPQKKGAIWASTSILRTCRTINAEAAPLLWPKNTLYFDSPSDVSKLLKRMGQTASRKIVRIRIDMGFDCPDLAKMLQQLRSRARMGCFERLELCWDEDIFYHWAQAGIQAFYDRMLDSFRAGFEGVEYEKVVRVIGEGEFEDIQRDVHFAVGGRLFLNEVEVWRDYQSVLDGKLITE